MTGTHGVAGRTAAAFIHSKLTPLVILASMALGTLAVVALPREEEPQIIVPMVDVFAEMPGATPADVEQRVTRPMEQLLWEVPGVDYVYSTSSPGSPRMRTASRQVSSDPSSSQGRSTMCRFLPSPCGRRGTQTISCERSPSNCGMPSPKSTTWQR